MFSFLLRRLISSFVVLFFVVSLTFLLARLQKGGPFDREKEPPPHVKEALEKKYRLNGNVFEQLLAYLDQLILHGDPGISTKYKDVSVIEILEQKMPNSLLLGACAFVLASAGGVALGFVSAARQGTWVDTSSMIFAIGAVSIPSFITGPLMIAVFGLWLKWLPVGGIGQWKQLILPSICLALPYLAYVSRLTRNSLLEVLQQPFIRTAKAKGLPGVQVIWKHAMKVAMLPVITYLGPMAAQVLTGSFIIEAVFNITGAGSLFVNAIQNKDVFILCGAVFVYCTFLVTFNLVVDVLYSFLDKRIKLFA